MPQGTPPCGDCRKDRYKAFKAAWAKVFPDQDQSAAGIDKVLQTARMNTDNSQRTWQASLADLPDGTMVEHEGHPVLLWRGRQWRWSFEGYSPLPEPMTTGVVAVLTSEPIVALFKMAWVQSYRPITLLRFDVRAKNKKLLSSAYLYRQPFYNRLLMSVIA